ncbi:MAG TPA: PAS domain S-box protein [Dehalococcoidales bacterium]
MRLFNKETFLNWRGYVVAIGSVALATWLKYLAQPSIIPTDVPILYLLAIVPTAIFFGFGPAILVCILSFLSYDFFFVPPIYHFAISGISSAPILVIFLLVGVLFSYLASNLREKNQMAVKEITARRQAEEELVKYRDHLEDLVKQRTTELEKVNTDLKQEVGERKKAEEFLRESEQRWATTLASIGDGVVATDVSGRITFMNSVAGDITGWTPREASTKPIAEVFNIINEHTRKRVDNPVDKVLQQGIICGLANHTILIRKNGTEVAIDDSGAPIKDEKGTTTGVVLTFRDITGRKMAEKALRLAEEHNRLLADILDKSSQPFGIGLPDGRLGIVNTAFCELTGYTAEELHSMDWANVLTPREYKSMETEKLAELAKTGKPIVYQKEYIRKDGSRVPIELLVHLVRGPNGEVEYYYSFLTDITERKKAEGILAKAKDELEIKVQERTQELAQSEKKYRLLFDSIDEGFCIIEVIFDAENKPVDYRFLETNQSFERQTGLLNAQGKLMRSLVPDHEEHWFETYGRIAMSGQPERFVNEAKALNRWYDVYAFRVDDPEKRRVALLFNDISQRKKMEEALKELNETLERRVAERTADLRETRDYLDNLFNYANAPIIVWNPDFKITRFNHAFERLTGRNAEEVLGQKLDILFPENTREHSMQHIRQAVAGERMEVEEIPIQHKDGSVRIALWNSATLYGQDNKTPTATIAQGQDITERKKTEEELQTALNRFYLVLSDMPLGLLLVTREGLSEFVNQAFCDTFNVKESPADLKNLTSLELIEKIRTVYLNPEKAMARIMEIVDHGEPVKDEEVPMRGERTFLRDFVPIHLGENNYGRLWIHRDITERKKAEQALVEAEAKSSALIKYAPTGIYEIDYRGPRFLSINDAMCSILGFTREELFDIGPGKLLTDDSQKTFADRIKCQLAGEKIDESVEYEVRKKDGSTIFATLDISFLKERPNTALVVAHDVTDRKKAEEDLKRYTTELETSNKELESFSYSVSHDLKAPLRGIDGFSEALLEDYTDKLDEQGKGYLRHIRQSSQLMGRLIDDILRLSRTSRADLRVEKINLTEIVSLIADELKQTRPGRAAEFIVSPEINAKGDYALITILLKNLLDNAWKFSEKSPQTRIEFGVVNHEIPQVFYVKDNGVGFDKRYYDKLFQPFSRLHSAEEYSGTGIGLAIAYRIVRRHGGRIWAEGEIGKGATFYFTLEE